MKARTQRAFAFPLLLLCLSWAGLPQPGHASQLKVSPVRLELGAERPVEVVTIGNPGSEPVLLQVRLRSWSHPGGRDTYLDSRDILVNPMVIELQPGEHQVVRVGLVRPVTGERELSYRLFVQELPDPGAAGGGRITTLLSLALPVFVAPSEALPPDLAWRVDPKSPSEIAVQIENRGNVHAEISSIALARESGEQVASFDRRIYVLPGQKRELVLPGGRIRISEPLTVTAKSIRGGRIETALRAGTVAPVEEAQR